MLLIGEKLSFKNRALVDSLQGRIDRDFCTFIENFVSEYQVREEMNHSPSS